MLNNKFNFTKSDIEKLPIPEKSIATYFDTGLKGLKLYVTANGVKTCLKRETVFVLLKKLLLQHHLF